MFQKTACPLCGSRETEMHSANGDMIVCVNCGETLYRHELVRVASSYTAERYNRVNGKELGYR